MKEPQGTKIVTVDSNQGQKFMIAGGDYRIIISGKETNGEFAIIEMSVPPGAGPNPHSHPNFEESFFVLDGEISFKSETGSYIAKQNSFVNIPKGGIIHSFKNLTNQPAKLLCTVIPAGLDNFFSEIAGFMDETKLLTESEISEKINAISEKYEQKLYNPDYLNTI